MKYFWRFWSSEDWFYNFKTKKAAINYLLKNKRLVKVKFSKKKHLNPEVKS